MHGRRRAAALLTNANDKWKPIELAPGPSPLVRAIVRKVRLPASLAGVNGSSCSSSRPKQPQGLQSRQIHILKEKKRNRRNRRTFRILSIKSAHQSIRSYQIHVSLTTPHPPQNHQKQRKKTNSRSRYRALRGCFQGSNHPSAPGIIHAGVPGQWKQTTGPWHDLCLLL